MSPGLETDLRTAGACGWPTTGFTVDPAYPDATADSLWLVWWRLLIKQEVSPGHRVLCNVTAPGASTDIEIANACAALAGVNTNDEGSPLAVAGVVIDAAGPPWTG